MSAIPVLLVGGAIVTYPWWSNLLKTGLTAKRLMYDVQGFKLLKGSSITSLKAAIDIRFRNSEKNTIAIDYMYLDVAVNNRKIAEVNFEKMDLEKIKQTLTKLKTELDAAKKSKGKTQSKSTINVSDHNKRIEAANNILAQRVIKSGTDNKKIPVTISSVNTALLLKDILSKTPPTEITITGRMSANNIELPINEKIPYDFSEIKKTINNVKEKAEDAKEAVKSFFDNRMRKSLRVLVGKLQESGKVTEPLSVYKKGLWNKYAIVNHNRKEIAFKYNSFTSDFEPDSFKKYEGDLVKTVKFSELA